MKRITSMLLIYQVYYKYNCSNDGYMLDEPWEIDDMCLNSLRDIGVGFIQELK